MKFGAVSVAIVACATVVSAGKLGTTALAEAFNAFVKTRNVEFKKINYEALYNALNLASLNEKGDRLKVDLKLTCSDDLKGENKGKETHITEFKFEKPIWKQVVIWQEAIRQKKILQDETHLWDLERIEEQERIEELKNVSPNVVRRKAYIDLRKTNPELDVPTKLGEEEKDLETKGTIIGNGDDFYAIAAGESSEKNRKALHLKYRTKDEINKLKAKINHAKMESWGASNFMESVKIAEDKKKEDEDKKKEDEDKKKEDEDKKKEDEEKKTEDEEKDGDSQGDEEKEILEEVPEAGVVIENITATVHCTPDGKVPKPGSGVARPSTVFAVVAPLAAAVLMMA